MSGGQQQRVAVARALITRPAVVFGDEPTGNLDSVSSREVLELMRRAVDDLGQTIVMVTHDPSAAAFADRVVFLADGRLAGTLERPGHRRDPRPPAGAGTMIALALRSMAQRKLRAALTAVAILLGVAMIAGTYVQTDQINSAFEQIEQTANEGVDVGHHAGARPSPATSRPRAAASTTPSARSIASRASTASPASCGRPARSSSTARRSRATSRRPRVISDVPEPFNAFRPVRGRLPAAAGEVAVNRKLAEDRAAAARPARRRDHAHGHPARPRRRRRRLRRRRLDRRRDPDRRAAAGHAGAGSSGAARSPACSSPARPASRPDELATRLRAVLGDDLEVKTGAQTAADDARGDQRRRSAAS